jgi:hypothetical protein
VSRAYGLHPATQATGSDIADAAMSEPMVDTDGTWPLALPGGPCRTWPVNTDCADLPDDPADWDAEQRAAVVTATDLLWRLTAGAYGLCRVTARPCTSGAGSGRRCGCGGGCPMCFTAATLALPGPVHHTPDDSRFGLEVWQNGQQVTAWRLLDGGLLARTDGQLWPRWQNLLRPLHGTAEETADTFGIVYWRGLPVGEAGARAVGLLTGEIVKACAGDDSCKLPARVEIVQRQGVTMRVVDTREFLAKGMVGVTEIDLWIASVNPHHRRAQPQVYTPDGIHWIAEPTSSRYPGGVA